MRDIPVVISELYQTAWMMYRLQHMCCEFAHKHLYRLGVVPVSGSTTLVDEGVFESPQKEYQ